MAVGRGFMQGDGGKGGDVGNEFTGGAWAYPAAAQFAEIAVDSKQDGTGVVAGDESRRALSLDNDGVVQGVVWNGWGGQMGKGGGFTDTQPLYGGRRCRFFQRDGDARGPMEVTCEFIGGKLDGFRIAGCLDMDYVGEAMELVHVYSWLDAAG